LGVAAWLMAETSLKDQLYKPVPGAIAGLTSRPRAGDRARLTFSAPGLDLTGATVIWEAAGMTPWRGPALDWRAEKQGPAWVEAEAQLPDGRRAFASIELTISR
jgi:hypothetical protein